MDYKHIKPIPGIYQIQNSKNKRLYVGSAKNIRKRIQEHVSFLTKNKHWNKFLQNDWQKVGPEYFVVKILEIVNELEFLQSAEQKWLDKCFDNQKRCYNIQPTVDRSIGIPHTKETKRKISQRLKNHPALSKAREKHWDIKLTSPKGDIYDNIVNLQQFAKRHNLNPASLWKLAQGYLLSYKGWRLLETPSDNILIKQRGKKISKAKTGCKRPDNITRCSKTYNVKLVNPEGDVFGPIYGLAAFARKHNLSDTKLGKLITGKAKTHKGWKVYHEK